jgi:PPOX class probable F420-dependent enzyme
MLDVSLSRDAHIERRLRSEPIIWLSSVRPDGRPHLVPVWFLWDGSSFLIFSQPKAQKVRNLRHNPQVLVALEAIDEGEDVAIFEGRATLLDDPAITPLLPAYVEKYAALLQRIKSDPATMAASYTQAIRVIPTRLL